MTTPTYELFCGDVSDILETLGGYKIVFADPPDNLGVKYEGFDDHWGEGGYYTHWLARVAHEAFPHCDVLWLSYNARWDFLLKSEIDQQITSADLIQAEKRTFIWRYTFGQHNKHDCGSGYRPILRIMRRGTTLYPDAICVESQRQHNKDARANPAGRVPDDAWDFPRVCGTFKERRIWFPNQHPEGLVERAVKLCCGPGDAVLDLFSGSGTTLRTCLRLGISCTSVEISPFYCRKIGEETGVPAMTWKHRELVPLEDAPS